MGDRLQYLIVGTSSAFSVRVNTKAQTLVIRYDPENVDPAEFLQEIVICVKMPLNRKPRWQNTKKSRRG